jgi:hypothetical protein
MFTNQSGAYGLAVDGDTGPSVVMSFRVAESSSAATTINKGQVVTIGTDQRVSAGAAVTGMAVGIATETVTIPDTDAPTTTGFTNDPQYRGPREISVCVFGLAEAQVSGTTVAAGIAVSTDANGRVTTAGTASGNYTVGRAVESTAGTAGDFKTIWVDPARVP